jgi:predicted nuclease with TOPRIM domain
VNAAKKLVKAAGFPVWKRLRWRVEQVTDERFGPRFDHLHAELEGVRGELRALTGRCDELHGHHKWHDDELRRLAAHVSALDSRLAGLERPGVDDSEPKSAVEEVRAEHARVRARLSAVARYEERLARLEETLSVRTGRTGE